MTEDASTGGSASGWVGWLSSVGRTRRRGERRRLLVRFLFVDPMILNSKERRTWPIF